jgi:proteasome accessory factor C
VNRPPDTAGRLRRLLAILAWLAQEGDAPIDAVAARFDLAPAALVAELEMAACCGVPPYTPDQLLEIVVTDSTVSTRLGTTLARPRRLSPREGLALAASARALLAVPGSDEGGALSRALSKLDRALGGAALDVELDSPEFLGMVRDALASSERVELSYYSASADQVTVRTVTPQRVFAAEGHWYLDAWCATAGDVRRFRVDRIRSARPVGGNDDRGPGAADGTAGGPGSDLDTYVPGPESRPVRLSLEPSMTWLMETIPAAEQVGEEHGRCLWEVYVGGDAWLERLLLRLGKGAEVVDPPELRSLAPEAASRILARYRGYPIDMK